MLQSAPNARYVYDENQLKLVKYFAANVSATTIDAALVPAVTGKRIKLLTFILGGQGTASQIMFNTKPSGAGTSISGLITVPATNTIVTGEALHGYMQTGVSEGLSITTGAGAIGVSGSYIEAEA